MSGKKHLSRLAAPRTWPIERKKSKWISKPSPGPHNIRNSLPLNVVLRDILNHVKNRKETKYVLNNKNILINGIARKDYNFSVGIFDILEIPKLNEQYLVIFNTKGKISVKHIDKSNANLKVSKIIGKTKIKGGKIQINLFDGNNYLLDKNNYNVGDSLVIDLANRKIKTHLPLEKGCFIYLVGGSNVGNIGKVKEIINSKDLQKPKIIFELDGKEHKTLKDYAFVIGKDKPIIEIKK